MKDYLIAAGIIIIGAVSLTTVFVLIAKHHPCYDGRSITETPNWCLMGR